MKIIRHAARAAAISVFLWASAAFAANRADHIPGDSIAVVQWAGADALAPQYQGSNLQGIMEASSLPKIFEKQLGEFNFGTFTGGDRKLTPSEVTILSAAWKYPGTLGILPVDLTAWARHEDPSIRAIYLIDAGKDAEALAKSLASIAATVNKETPSLALSVKQFDTSVAVILGALTADEQAAIESGKGALAKTDFYTKGSEQLVKNAAVSAMIDGPKALAMIEDVLTKDPSTTDKQRDFIKGVIDVLGVRSLGTMTYSAGFEGKEWSEKTFIAMGKDRHGLLILADNPPLTDDVLKMVPKTTPSVNIVRLDLPRIVKEIRAGMAKADPDDLKKMDENLQEMKETMGVDIEKDIIAPLGHTFTLYRLGAAGDKDASFAFVHALRDGKTLAAAIEKVLPQIPFVQITKEEVNGAKVWTIEHETVAVAIAGDLLVISPRVELDDAIAQGKAKSSILDRAEFVELRKAMPQVPVQALDFVDLKSVYAQSEAGIKELLHMAANAGIDIPEDAVPDVEKIAKFLTPGMSVTWQDEVGFHMQGRSAFPLAGVIGFQQASFAPVIFVGAAATVPSIYRAREREALATEMVNVSEIVKACVVYAVDKDDKMPEDLAELIANHSIGPKNLISPRSGTKPLELTDEQMKAAEKDWHTIQKLVAEHCDYVYLGKGTKGNSDADQILLFTKTDLKLKDGIFLGYFDAHVEFARYKELKELFTTVNETRKKQNLPEVKLDDKGMPISQ